MTIYIFRFSHLAGVTYVRDKEKGSFNSSRPKSRLSCSQRKDQKVWTFAEANWINPGNILMIQKQPSLSLYPSLLLIQSGCQIWAKAWSCLAEPTEKLFPQLLRALFTCVVIVSIVSIKQTSSWMAQEVYSRIWVLWCVFHNKNSLN